MKKIAISQPRYLPSCNYIERIIMSDVFVMLDTVQHQKRAFEHRNKIKVSNGTPCWLSIPADRKNSASDKINDLLILNEVDWYSDHLKSFQLNYKNTPYYNEVIALLEQFYSSKKIFLNDAVKEMLDILVSYFDLNVNIVWASDYDCWKTAKDDLLIEITKYFGGNAYVSGPNGRNYINPEKFVSKEIKLLYHDYKHPVYKQLWGNFLPYMTIWDAMFYNGKDTINLIKTGHLNEE